MVNSNFCADNVAFEMDESFSDEGAGSREATEEPSKNFIDQTRSNDIRLLDYMNVGIIVDLMVEKKKVKYGLK